MSFRLPFGARRALQLWPGRVRGDIGPDAMGGYVAFDLSYYDYNTTSGDGSASTSTRYTASYLIVMSLAGDVAMISPTMRELADRNANDDGDILGGSEGYSQQRLHFCGLKVLGANKPPRAVGDTLARTARRSIARAPRSRAAGGAIACASIASRRSLGARYWPRLPLQRVCSLACGDSPVRSSLALPPAVVRARGLPTKRRAGSLVAAAGFSRRRRPHSSSSMTILFSTGVVRRAAGRAAVRGSSSSAGTAARPAPLHSRRRQQLGRGGAADALGLDLRHVRRGAVSFAIESNRARRHRPLRSIHYSPLFHSKSESTRRMVPFFTCARDPGFR